MDNTTSFATYFDLHSHVRDIKRNIWAIVLAALIAFMGTYIVSRSVYTPTYTSTATLVVRARVGTAGSYMNLSVSSEMANIFTEVFKQPTTGYLAAAYLGEDSFDGTISASVVGETNLIRLSITADDPEHAYRLLCAVLEIYPDLSAAVFTNAVIDVILSPEVPTSPSNYISNARTLTYMMLAACFEGALIVLISLLRGTVKNEKIFNDHVDAKLLGTVIHEKPHLSFFEKLIHKKRALLINDGYSTLKFSEDYQKIATKMEYLKKMSKNRIFSITSVGENEGKSTAAANTAIALAARGYRVALLDLDVRKPSIFKIFGYAGLPFTEMTKLFADSPKPNSYFLEDFRYKNSSLFLFLNSVNHNTRSEWVNSSLVREWIQAISEEMDFVILDTAPMAVSADAVSLAGISAQTVLVVRTDRASIEDVNESVMTITSGGGVFAGCILNDVHKSFTFFNQIGADAGENYKYYYGVHKRQGAYGVTAENKKAIFPDIN